jgi:hypothetical protein
MASALSLSGTRFGYSPFQGMDIGWGNGNEVVRLRRELERVKEERDILKKAAAYFAKEIK